MATMDLDQTSRSTSIIAGTDGTFKTTVTSGLWIDDDHVYAPIRDAQQAIKRGIKPVPKKEFFRLARQIADSVKHRGAIPSEK